MIFSSPPEISCQTLFFARARRALVDVRELHGLADAEGAAVGLLLAAIMRNSVVLPAPLGPMTPTMPPRGRLNVRSSMSSRSPKPCARARLDHHVAEALGPRGSGSRWARAFSRLVLGEQLLVGREAGLALGLPRARGHAHPLELALERLARARLLLLLVLEALRFCSSHAE
jgi:hypothetical protein